MNFWVWMIVLTLPVHVLWWVLACRPLPFMAAVGYGVLLGVGLAAAGIHY